MNVTHEDILYPWDRLTVYDVFSTVAKKNKEKVFIHSAEGEISYGDLLERVDQAAAVLYSLKLDIERPIAVCLPSGPDWAVVVLALMQAGHFYIPLDPDFPKERNHQILTDSNAALLVGSFGMDVAFNIPTIAAHTLFNPVAEPVPVKEFMMNAGLKACIIYTSGSTGKPKGVIQTHQSILHGAWRRSALQEISIEDRMTWLYSPSVKGSEYCFFVALLNGASLYVRKIMDHFDDAFIHWMAANKITVYHSVASYFRYVAGSLQHSGLPLEYLRLVILGGERVLKSDLDLFFESFPDTCRLFTGLGATETGTICHYPFAALAKVEQSVVPIGYPVNGIRLELLDEERNLIHKGTGRLCVRSRYISPGYWNESSDKFTQAENGEIVYESGDLAEIDENGVYYHRGRGDNAVKINGYLVNLLEVEASLMLYPNVAEAIVIALEVDFQNRLYAFIETSEPAIDTVKIKSFLNTQLVKQMVPLHYTIIEQWPRLANGKIDRKKLINLVQQTAGRTENKNTELEEKVLTIWKKVLAVNDVAKNKTFSEAGGDSIATLRLALEFKRAGFTTINLADLVKNDTIEKQAHLLVLDTNSIL